MVQSTTGALTTSYRYNGLGERVSKTETGSNTVSRRFVYDEMGHLIGEYDGADAPIQETVYLGDVPVAVLSGTGGIHYVHADQINTPRAITDTQGAVVWRWESDPFGIGAPDQDPDGDGLIREYDPSIGRYVQSDPIGLAGALNTYAYVGNDPLRFSDPWGLVKCVYAIATHSLSCVSNDGTSAVTAQQGLHSGIGPCRDNPSCEGVSDLGPVPSDTYNVSANTLPGREGWWALQSKSWTPNIDGLLCRFGVKRCGFNVHLGTFSRGCITFNKYDPNAVDAYDRLNDLFSSDSPDNTLTVIPNNPSPVWP